VSEKEYQGEERRASQGWHVDKTVSISHVLTTITILIAGLWYMADQDKRIAANTQSIEHNIDSIKQQESRTSKSLDDIHRKLDKLTDIALQRK